MKVFIISLTLSIVAVNVIISQCNTAAIVNPDGTISIQSNTVSVMSECYDYNNESFIASLLLVKCDHINEEYIIMIDDLTRIYYFNLPEQNQSHYGDWCSSSNQASFFQSIKSNPKWLHRDFSTRCQHVRTNGDRCKRFSGKPYCKQHR